MEVDTPVLAAAGVTDPYLRPMSCRYQGPGAEGGRKLYLQTSPEHAMKRLLAAGSGPIYQICKVFRDGEAGRLHSPEFTLVEWYRPGFDHHALMDEMDAFLAALLLKPKAERLTYAEVYLQHLGLDPHTASLGELRACARKVGIEARGLEVQDRDGWLQLLMTHAVEARLGRGRPCFVFDYPPSQAALARVRPDSPPVAERFEVYVEGVELANGYHELTDAEEQRRRLDVDLKRRRAEGLEEVPLDERLLAALSAGLPDGAGVALGVDRLVMLACGAKSLEEVIAFPLERA